VFWSDVARFSMKCFTNKIDNFGDQSRRLIDLFPNRAALCFKLAKKAPINSLNKQKEESSNKKD